MKTLFHASVLVGALLVLDACGSPDGGGTGGTGVLQPPPSASIPQPTQSVGVIHAKTTNGNIVNVQVNRRRFDVSGAVITKDGKAATGTDLRVGMVVAVKSSADGSGTALSVNYRNRILGTLTAIDSDAVQLTVLGQTVHLNADTMLYDASTQMAMALTALSVGDYVEVSGFTDALNIVQASYLERKPAENRFEVKGTVSALNENAHRFCIGGLTVNYNNSAAAEPDGTERRVLHNGDAVAVSGHQYNSEKQLLVADSVIGDKGELDSGSDFLDSLVEVEGRVTSVPSANLFTIGTQTILTDTNTVVESGAVTLNAWVTVLGTLNSNGILAQSVQIH